ncbi:MAG: NAD-dependent epimerase/dehydratase family protein [Planctomycetota bacterium]|nr:NAD-dependent epimerase/dehydratase family protein [Planctomycetota bacterium]
MTRPASGTADILVTGGTGFLGRALAARMPEARFIGSADVDLCNGAAVEEIIGRWRPRVVVDLAARVGGITANMAQPADFLVDNLRMGANLLAALRKHPPEHLVVALSTCIYPDRLADEFYPLSEDHLDAGPPPPTNAAYALAKRALWYGARALKQQYGVGYTALVPTNLYGPGDHFGSEGAHFLAAAVDKIEAARRDGRPEAAFFGSGQALRQLMYVDDLAWVIAEAVKRGPHDETLNVANPEVRSIRELAEVVAREAGFEGEVRFTGEGPDGQFRKDVSTARLSDAFPAWEQVVTPLEEGVRRTLGWYRQHVATR